ncbi:MAG: 1,2-phenylacetyl-CoA epoxidase subunit PaaD [Candidatus Tyrphobacter sp.]
MVKPCHPERREHEVLAESRDRHAFVRRILDDVRDPEMPMLSITDLGIVRGVQRDGDAVVVTLTPTYAGCPAMRAIEEDVLRALSRGGIEKVRVQTSLSPPWTTDWITPRGRERLARSGIAPPVRGLEDGPTVVAVRCPHCGSFATQERSRFGPTPCTALYACSSCREPFEHVKAF